MEETKKANLNHLNAINIKMSADRTLMAWTTMSLSMVSFGFAIYQILHSLQKSGTVLPREEMPQNVGTFLVLTGTLAIVMGTISYWYILRHLRRVWPFGRLQPVLIIALLTCGLGLFVSINIIIRRL